MLSGLNHITITVSDLERSLHFYTHTLGMKAHVKWNQGAYLSLGSLWFCLSCGTPCPKTDYTHIAFDIPAEHFTAFTARLALTGIREWKVNRSEGASLYLLDPDGHQLEIHAGDLKSRLESLKSVPYTGMEWL
ncbi:Glutathione transferase FosA [Vibrio aerogenes CECT 7868]|uniref:Glutathione transferase FosA n=1 Tax=Vibrio aerogenes CECT 7868 TaxID=1216006 RepID=A0A1M5Z7T7_9VIBR|nr:fosfomycin resistance glutathione transferase [Vibrio aerogenes]SHI20261.1 Glutathione transferase FosA [Vibrio aerogenes CECT 7868]